jgi:hypothetical protein
MFPRIRRPIEGDAATIIKGTWVGKTCKQIARANREANQNINWL